MTKKYFEHVGSFLRPQELQEARAGFEAGTVTAQELKSVEDQAIKDLVDKQIAAGLEKVTDGEFRRAYWHLDFFWGFNGVDHVQAAEGYHFHDETTKPDSASLVGKITGENHPFVEAYKFLRPMLTKQERLLKLNTRFQRQHNSILNSFVMQITSQLLTLSIQTLKIFVLTSRLLTFKLLLI